MKIIIFHGHAWVSVEPPILNFAAYVLIRALYRTRAMANRSRFITAPLKKHANFSFLFHFWAKVSLQKEEKMNYNRGLPWRAYGT